MSFGLSRGRTLVTDGFGIEATELPPFDPADRVGSREDPREWFDASERRLEIEIGSGKGTFLVQYAPAHPSVNLLGIERAGEFYRYAADRIRRHDLANVRMLRGDAVEFLRYRCPDGIVAVIHLYFSDPWPKTRHHKRRVVQDSSLDDFHRVLGPGGEVRLVTDHPDLWTWYEAHAERHSDRFERLPFESGVASPETGELVGTNYERKFAGEGRVFHAMTLRRR